MKHAILHLMVVPLYLAVSGMNHTAAAEATSPDPHASETKEQRDARMAWWREAKFGMFIHWGVYAVPAGEYQGKPVITGKVPPGRYGEWIMRNAEIPISEYREFAKDFNPIKYEPDTWVLLAKAAGMKYIVITAKHHDGFALFDSKASTWDVVDATPYGRDLIAPLAEACRKHDVKLGLYYSQAQDWVQGGSAKKFWDPAQSKETMDEYLDTIAVPQVREILSNYGPISILWWDTPHDMNKERAEKLLPLLKLQPGIIHNNRLGGGYEGDTETPEQKIPKTGLPGDWETCMTINNTWGYRKDDHDWKPAKTLIRNLVDTASKGGNYLLNVGPTAGGEIPEASVERLEQIAAWMNVNAESIHGTTATPCDPPAWGRITKKLKPGGATLYLHVFDWPTDGKLVVPGLKNRPESITLLVGGASLKAEPLTGAVPGLVIDVPNTAPDAVASVLKLEIKGDLEIGAVTPKN